MCALMLLVLAATPTPLPWALDGQFVQEDALFELRCAATQEELCSVLDVSRRGYLVVEKGRLHFYLDGECGDLVFSADMVGDAAAEGVFADREVAMWRDPENGWNYVQVWRDGKALVLRGATEDWGKCEAPKEPRVRVQRFVHARAVREAANRRAAEIGVDVAACSYKTTGKPKVGPCRLNIPKLPGQSEKPVKK